MTKREMQDKIFYMKLAIDDYETLIEQYYEPKKELNEEKKIHALCIKKRAKVRTNKAKGIK